ncbi:MAG: hypothetical protein IPJ76_15080 [Flavobacteriales bacterium]|nr:MAG: hypothetical protein IPJ76_15080 [Flavobacteriales bacterium]
MKSLPSFTLVLVGAFSASTSAAQVVATTKSFATVSTIHYENNTSFFAGQGSTGNVYNQPAVPRQAYEIKQVEAVIPKDVLARIKHMRETKKLLHGYGMSAIKVTPVFPAKSKGFLASSSGPTEVLSYQIAFTASCSDSLMAPEFQWDLILVEFSPEELAKMSCDMKGVVSAEGNYLVIYSRQQAKGLLVRLDDGTSTATAMADNTPIAAVDRDYLHSTAFRCKGLALECMGQRSGSFALVIPKKLQVPSPVLVDRIPVTDYKPKGGELVKDTLNKWFLLKFDPAVAERIEQAGIAPYTGQSFLGFSKRNGSTDSLVLFDMKSDVMSWEYYNSVQRLIDSGQGELVGPTTYYRVNGECIEAMGKAGKTNEVSTCLDSVKFMGIDKIDLRTNRGTETWVHHGDTMHIEVQGLTARLRESEELSMYSLRTPRLNLASMSMQYESLSLAHLSDFFQSPMGTLWAESYYDHDPSRELRGTIEHAAKRRKEAEQKSEAVRQELIGKYGAQFGQAIFNGDVLKGMTKEMFDLTSRGLFSVKDVRTSGNRETYYLTSSLNSDYHMKVVFVSGKVESFSTY